MSILASKLDDVEEDAAALNGIHAHVLWRQEFMQPSR